MNLLLAPNEKPSNLTPEQYKLVRTPEFKAWFGDWENSPETASKVVDENGEPLVVYHGNSHINFNVFVNGELSIRGKDAKGWYFTRYKNVAENFSGINGFVKEVFLKIMNIKIAKSYIEIGTINKEYVKNAVDSGYDGAYFMPDKKSLEMGFLQLYNEEFVPFEPEQIKLADGTNKTFDGSNTDIRFDGGGNVSLNLIKKANKISNTNEYLNCDLFCHRMVDNKLFKDEFDIVQFKNDFKKPFDKQYNDLIKVLKVGDIIAFGDKNRVVHYSIYLGNDDVLEVEMWGKKPRKFSLKKNLYNYESIAFIYREKNNFDIRFDGGGLTKNQNNMVIKFTENQIDYLADQVDVMIETYDNDYDDNGILDEAEADYLKYPETICKDRNDLENLKLKILNKQGSSYTKIEKDVLISRIDMTLDALYNDSEVAGGKRSLISAQKKLQENNTDYEEGGNINWNVDRYRQLEKEMYDLQTQGKTDTLEYFKLIKERAILEQAKMNTSTDSENYFAKGGKVVVLPADIQKYKKIGIEDKYFIEASKDVGLQGINFDSKSILKRIESQFNDMLDNYQSYLISEDSPSITNYINNEIETHKEQGSSLETIQRLEQMKENESSRRSVIDDIAKTQKESLEKWVDYLRSSEYSLPFKFLMLKAVLNFNYDLKQNKLFERGKDTIRNFTPFDAGSLAELNTKNSDYLLMDYNVTLNENSSRILNSQEVVEQSGNGKWIKFNGGRKTKPEDITKNGNRLMNLVQNTYWCTKSAGTSQLRGGDFYVYVTETNGEIFPRIAVRMNENEVGEVRGNKSSSQDLDADMLPIAEEFLNKNIPNNSGKKWLDSIKYNKKCVEMKKRLDEEGMYKDFIYDYIKIIADKDKYRVDYGQNGNVTIMEQKFEELIKVPNEHYKLGDIVSDYRFLTPNTIYFIGNLGWNEIGYIKSKIENVSDVRDFTNFKLKLISGKFEMEGNMLNLGNIEYVGENVILNTKVKDLGKLKYIGGELKLNDNVESLSMLESISGGLVLTKKIKDLGNLKKIGYLQIEDCDENFTLGSLEEIEGNLDILNKSVDIDFGNLKRMGGSLLASNTKITDLKNLESVGDAFYIQGSKIKIFENLKTIGGDADFSNNFCSSTQNIETILGNIKFLNSRIMEFPKLNKIGGTIEFRGSFFKSFGNIKYIGGNLNLADSKLEELGSLEYVGGYVSFKGSKIQSLNKLKKIVGFANFEASQVVDLGDLESVGGNLYLKLSKIKSLGKLNYVGGIIFMNKNNYKGLEGFYDEIVNDLNSK